MFLSANPSTTELMFFGCAAAGSLFFLMRLVLIFIGGVGAEDFDFDGDIDAADADAGDVSDTDTAFKVVSLNSIGAFIMMFGWGGLAANVQYGLGLTTSFLIALAVGFLTMYATAKFLKKLGLLQSGGMSSDLSEVVGTQAEVYQRIPAGGHGKIQVNHNGLLRELKAQSESTEDIESFTKVIITGLTNTSGVIVAKA